MLEKRKWKWLGVLTVLPILMMVFSIGVGIKANHDNRTAFDNLREGMTLEEASEVLGRDLHWDKFGSGYTGASYDVYQCDMGCSIIPGDSGELRFYAGTLSTKEWHSVGLHELLCTILYRCRRLLGI